MLGTNGQPTLLDKTATEQLRPQAVDDCPRQPAKLISLDDKLGDRKKLAEFCFRQVSSAVQAANSGRYELLPPPKKAA